MRNPIAKLAALAACMIAVSGVPAQQVAKLGLREYLDAVSELNLNLQAQRQTVTSTEAGVSIAGVRPDPQFGGGIASKELYGPHKPSASTATTASIAFTLETGGKRDARLRAARSNCG
jgi:cobalt-zinc-cadmium efflux system outer membrane protein